jgi:hypothetical protein
MTRSAYRSSYSKTSHSWVLLRILDEGLLAEQKNTLRETSSAGRVASNVSTFLESQYLLFQTHRFAANLIPVSMGQAPCSDAGSGSPFGSWL